MRASPITVTRFDPKTGEVQGEPKQVAHDHFKPKLPTRPRLDQTKITLVKRGHAIGPTGRSVVHVATQREEEIAYWEAHASILTREERRDIAGGHVTAVNRPIRPAWEKGNKVGVGDKIEATVLEIEETLRGYRTVLRVIDFRPVFMKQTVGGGSTPKVDAYGYPAEPTKDEIDRARADGSYTRSPSLAVPGAGDVLDDKIHARLNAETDMKNALKQSRARHRVKKMDLERMLNDARKKHRRSTTRHLERRIASLASKEEQRAAA